MAEALRHNVNPKANTHKSRNSNSIMGDEEFLDMGASDG
jgi:hypothetical protein